MFTDLIKALFMLHDREMMNEKEVVRLFTNAIIDWFKRE